MGRAVFRAAVLALSGAVNATVVAHQKDVRRAVNKSESVLVHVHHVVAHAGAVVSAREVVPGRAGAAGQPDFERIEEDTIRIIGIDHDALVVPVLRIVGAAGRADTAAGAAQQ